MATNKSVEVLNTLIEINNDRIEGYDTASKETKEQDLKQLFAELIQTSQKCKEDLSREVRSLGGQPTEGTKVTGKFFRTWMDVKAALTGNDRLAILNSCEFGEDQAVETYESVLQNDLEDINPQLQALVRSEYSLIKSDHDRVRDLRNALKSN